MKTRVLFVGRTRYRLPLPSWLERKWDAVGDALELPRARECCGRDALARPRFELIRRSAAARRLRVLRAAALPRSARDPALPARRDRRRGPAHRDARHARATARRRSTREGDPRGARRLAALDAPLRLAAAAAAVAARRRARPLRPSATPTRCARSRPTRRRSCGRARRAARRPSFPTYIDLSVVPERPPRPLPERPTALFVGVLERYKNVDGLVAAWRRVADRAAGGAARRRRQGPDATARSRSSPPSCRERRADRTSCRRRRVARALDDATVLVLPSRSEGLGRVVIEAFARGRGVVGSRAGGVLDLVDDGRQRAARRSGGRRRARRGAHPRALDTRRRGAARRGRLGALRRLELDRRRVRRPHEGARRRPL